MNTFSEITQRAAFAILKNNPSKYLTHRFDKNGAMFEDFNSLGVNVRIVYQNGITQYFVQDINA